MTGVPTRESDAEATDQLLTWASKLTIDDLPKDAVETLRDDLLDGLGCGLFGSTLPATRSIRSVLLDQAAEGKAPCTVWGTPSRASALAAVVINTAALNGFELDDYCTLVRGTHGAATVYPVLLAVSELTGAVSGNDFLAAAAAGWETSYRVSLAMGPTVLDHGYYPTPMYATLGSAVAAGRALHLTPDQMKECFNLAILNAGGLSIASEEGMGKPLSSGEAIRSGLLCALLAAKGGRGPSHAYDDPRKGFAAVFGAPEERNDEALIVKKGDPLACVNVGFKAYASCGAGQVVTDVIGDLMEKDASIGPATVDNVELRINVTSAGHVGGPYLPRDVTNAQFNLRYCVAAQLLEGDNSAYQFREELLADKRIMELTSRVSVVADPHVGVRSTALRNESFVKIRLKDGTVLEGHAEKNRYLDRARLRKKFSGLASEVISFEAESKLIETVDQIENLKDASTLTSFLSTAVG